MIARVTFSEAILAEGDFVGVTHVTSSGVTRGAGGLGPPP